MKSIIPSFAAVLFFAFASCANGQEENISAKFPHKMGNLLLDVNFLNFNYLKDTEEKSDTIHIYNNWDQAMEVSPEKPPKYIDVKIIPSTLPAKSEGMIIVSYSGVKRAEYGFVRYSMGLRTNDAVMMVKTFPVNAYIEEDFSQLSAEEMANAPKLVIPLERYDFGTIKSGDVVKYSFRINNGGKRDLVIRSTQASCGCTATKPEKTVIAPGEETYIAIEFDSRGRTGKQHKTVSIYTNDPHYSSATLHIEGMVE